MSQGPPRLGFRILRRFCPPSLVESVEGDLIEAYERHLKQHRRWKANMIFLYQVIRFFRWGIISRNHPTMYFFNHSLIGNHLKLAVRNYRRHLGYSLINLTGLSVGLAVCFILFSYTRQELSYDDFHRDIEKMYRVNQTNIWTQDGGWFASTAPPLAEQALQEIPGIEAALRINTPGSFEVRYHPDGQKALVFQENDVLAADSNFFDFFTIPVVAGDPHSALVGKNKAVITEETARKYFGNEPAIGKILLLGDDRVPIQVSAVTADLPVNMHFKFNLLLSMPSNPLVKQFNWSWIWSQVVTYVKVKPGTSISTVNDQMTRLFNPKVRATLDRIGMDYDDFMQGKGNWQFELQPVRSIHLHSTGIGNRLGVLGDIKVIRILQILALLVLVLALINFVNLSTARANMRSKEIGVKKSIGATTINLAQQFQTESVFMTFLAGILAIPVVYLLSALIERSIGIVISFGYFGLAAMLLAALILLGIGFLAGIYPSIYLSSLRPITVLGANKTKSGSTGMRNVLVTVQFAISLALLSGSLLISKQLNYLSQKNLGFDRENVLVIRNAEKLTNHVDAFRDELIKTTGILDASVAMNVPGQIYYQDIFSREGSDIKLSVNQLKIDPYYFPTLGLKLLVGRNFEPSNPGDQSHVIISETTARLFGWTPEEALHQHIIYPGLEIHPEVIGVSQDFNFQSLYEDIAPIIFFRNDAPIWGDGRVIAIKYLQDQESEVIAQAHRMWDRFNADSPFNYAILNDELAGIYNREHQLSSLVSLLCMLSIFIAALGLIGLVSFTLDQRRKEIGIRKVLGASLGSILFLINRQYLVLFLIGLLIAVPFTWSAVRKWLTDFAYQIPITWTSFVLAGIILMGICLILVGVLIYNANRANPIRSIRQE